MKAVAVGTRVVGFLIIILLLTPLVSGQKSGGNTAQHTGEAQWIWSSAHQKNEVPVGDCFFRKSFQLTTPELGEIQITADNRFVLFVNGQQVGQGQDWRQMQVFDISKHLKQGRNCVAVQVTNTDPGSAGLVVRVLLKEQGGTFESFATDKSWKTSVRHYRSWTSPDFPDREWVNAESYGELGATLPWGNEVVFDGEGTRFSIGKEFTVERLMRDDEVGSLIAMTFDSKGNILASQEGGPLLLLTDTDGNSAHDTVSVYCDQIKNTQGILALGTRVFAVGDGPQGPALYRLRDANRDGIAEQIEMLVPIRGSKGEHGAHAVRLGPDGLLYVIVGNHARVGRQPGSRSPYCNAYEGDLVQPRQQDPRGHAVGIPSPGGTIFRTDASGNAVELVAGGLRNSYDFVFNPDGELFTYDADMEWDAGAPWYRPTRVNHVTPGAELGWRSGWAKWPAYYLDSLPAVVNLGAGSPTGVEFYNHTAFPPEYRGTMFGCDWATGRIYSIRLKRRGATYRATSEVFLEGRPLNATDIAVGPDGALYFCTGGRGTDGGIYRVRWTGKDAAKVADLGQGIDRALRQPQLDADWARTQIAAVKRELGNAWPRELERAALEVNRELAERLRALDLMVYFGPRPTESLLLRLTTDKNAAMRARAARMLSMAKPQAAGRDRLVALLEDRDPLVRRVACESLLRQGYQAPAEALVRLLADDDRFVAFAARRTLEQLPTSQWAHLVLEHPRQRAFCNGCVSLLAMSPNASTARAALERCQRLLSSGQSSDSTALGKQQFVDLLRVAQLALIHGKLTARDVPNLGRLLLTKYPSGNRRADRELVRLLVYLQVPESATKFAAQLASDLPPTDKLHLGAYASRLEGGWEADDRLALLNFYEQARALPGGYSVSAYIENFARDFFSKLSLGQRRQILAEAERWPTSALSVLAKLPADPGAEILGELRKLDGRIEPRCAESDVFRRLRVGILATLGRSGEPMSLAYLRTVYDNQPKQRPVVAMSLTQHPAEENWSYLVDALKTVEGRAAREVLHALATVPRRPRHPEPYRQVILQGLRLGGEGAEDALNLLDSWAGRQPAAGDWQRRLAAWQNWYAEHFPNAPAAELPVDTGQDKWSYEELLSYLESDLGRAGDPERGRQAYAAAQCNKCHQIGDFGEPFGPELTSVAKRFQKKEILESIVYPSHVVSDQYASRVVVSNGRPYTGIMLASGQDGVTLLLSDGEKINFSHDTIDAIQASGVSVMPTGLLNSLTLAQVADLFAFLEQNVAHDVAQKKPIKKR